MGALATAALMVTPATAAVPTFERSFDGSTITPTPANPFTPGEVAVDRVTGDIWVVDTANNVIDRFSSAGVYEAQLTGVETTARAFNFGGYDGIAVDNSGGANQGNLYIATEPAPLIGYSRTGTFLWETLDNINNICGVAVGPDGRVWGSDYFRGMQERNPATGAAVGPTYVDVNNFACSIAIERNSNALLNVYAGSVSRFTAPDYVQANGTVMVPDASHGVASDWSTGDIYTALDADRISMHSSAGVADAGSPFGAGNYGGVTVNSDTHRLYASLPASGRVEVYATPEPPPARNLRVTFAGTGRGSVVSDPAGISCATTCDADFTVGTEVRLTATPSNSALTWTGCDSTVGNDCRVTLNADTEVTATFAQDRPTVGGEAATSITDRAATLGGTANANGASTTCEIQWGLTAAYGTTTPVTANPVTGTSPVAVRIPALSGLTADTTYHYRLNCTNAGGTTNGSDRTFRTSPAPAPVAVTGAASSVTQTSASLAGTVNPRGYATTCYFEYGPTTAYGSRADCATAPGSGTSTVNVSAALSGLTAGTTYHFRLVANSAGGTVNGSDGTFTTEARTCATDPSLCRRPDPPTCETDPSLCRRPDPPTCATDPSLCPAPTLSLDSSSASVRGGKAEVKLSCDGSTGTCSGRVQLTARVRTGRRGRSRSVVIGSANVSIAAGRAATIRISLSRAARSALARSGRLSATISGPNGLSGRVTLRQPVRRARRRARRGRR